MCFDCSTIFLALAMVSASRIKQSTQLVLEEYGHKTKSECEKENRRLLLVICSFKKEVLPFSASSSARIFWYLSLAMNLRALSFYEKKVKVKMLFGLLGESSRK